MKHVTLTEEQQNVKTKIEKFINDELDLGVSASSYITIGGYAGTGKTTLIRSIRAAFDKELIFHYMAYTGKASMRISQTLDDDYFIQYPKDQISTIHSALYRLQKDEHGRIFGWTFDRHKTTQDVIIIDEASMVPSNIYNDLMQKGVPIIFIGDHGQLPPITKKGEPDFNLMSDPMYRLNTIHRNADGIKLLAADIRESKELNSYPNVEIRNKPFTMLQEYDSNKDVIIAGFNATRLNLNRTILKWLCFSKELQEGMKIIAGRNNWKNDPPIYNGQIFFVKEILRQADEYYIVTLKDDTGVLYEAIQIAKYAFKQKVPYAPKSKHLTTRRGDAIYIPYTPMQYAYCITCHKAQGSEWDKVIVVNEAFGDEENKRRWLYTAVTRASKELVLYLK